jgi:mono/diheme cytochrome c family protein/uncharacterized protein YjiS (DUF1127 family)
MTAIVAPLSAAALRWWRIATLMIGFVQRAIVRYRTRRALNGLSDTLLRDVGLNRSEIHFVADAVASGTGDTTRDPEDHINRSAAYHKAERETAKPRAPKHSLQAALHLALFLAGAVSALATSSHAGLAQDAQIKRGKYLVTFGGCNDCHTPGYFFGKPDMARFLGGSEVGFEIPGLGVFHGPNLTPDQETGLGTWSTEQIVTAITTGKRPDGRMLSPIMPWHAFANLTAQDSRAIAAFLKSLPPVRNKVPGPFGPGENPTSFVMKVLPPEAAATGDAVLK